MILDSLCLTPMSYFSVDVEIEWKRRGFLINPLISLYLPSV